MKIVIAIDSLKDSLTSIQSGKAIKKGIQRVDQEAGITQVTEEENCRRKHDRYGRAGV